jgi:hypothetical protein
VVIGRKSQHNLYVSANIFDNAAGRFAWKLLRDGVLKAFSAAVVESSAKLIGEVEGKRSFSEWTVKEVSLCPGLYR